MSAPSVPEKSGFAALTKEFLNTDPYQCILCGNRLRFMSVEKGIHATALLPARRGKMVKNDSYKPLHRISEPNMMFSDEN